MKKIRMIAMFAALVMLLSLSSVAVAESTASIVGGRLYMRQLPSFEGKVLAVYNSGTQVTVKDTTDPSWFLCVGPDGKTGYMFAQYLKIHGGGEGGGGFVPGDTAYVTSGNGLGVNLRLGPGSDYQSLGTCPVGTKVTILASGVNWCYISVGSTNGFMMTKYLTKHTPPSPSYTAYVTSKNGLNVQLRVGPGRNEKVIAAFPVGQEVTVLYKVGEWSHIEVANKKGYMMSQYLTKTKPSPITPPAGAAVVISGNGLNVRLRKGPGTDYKVLGSYKPGSLVTILEEGSVWDRVKIGNQVGYMMKSYILKSK